MNDTHVFAGYKAIGFVTNDVPICVGYYRKRKEPYVITCIGRSFHLYNVDKLAIVNISDPLPEPIKCLKVDQRFVYVSSGKKIYLFIQWKKVWKVFEQHDHDVKILLPFADHLISIDEESCLKVWDVKEGVLFSEMDLNVDTFTATTAIHPHDYVNKILVGSEQGTMKLLNLSQNKIIYSYDGWNSAITALSQSQAVNVVGVGLKDGRIILHDLKFDETLMTFMQEWGPVTTLSFRTDKNSIMVAGSAFGHIGVWDLEQRGLLSQLNEAHLGSILGLECLQSEPIMLTSSTDNSLKKWVFDLSDGGARLLTQRSGHSRPPVRIRFHGASGNEILSAGLDSTLRCFSTIHDSNNKSLGRASYNKKISKKMGLKEDSLVMSPVVDFCSETARQSDWDGLLACHNDESMATTWNFNRSCMGQYKFKPHKAQTSLHPAKKVIAKSVTITACGNFGLVGYNDGRVDVFNMQSGIHRGCYDDGNGTAHAGSITGVFVDELNQTTVTMAMDGCLKFWGFKSKKLAYCEKMDVLPLKGVLQRENNLLAVALSDFAVIAVDLDTRRVARKFEGHRNDITDMAFARQGRWLITSCMDCCIRIYDLFSSLLIDIFQLHSPVTSLAVSPTDELLATTHADDLGIYLWYNKALYMSNALQFSGLSDRAADRPELVSMPEPKCVGRDEKDDDTALEPITGEISYVSPNQIGNLLTFSNHSEARWLPLLNIDAIKERNKLTQAVTKPKNVPFFLPTKKGLEFEFEALPQDENEEDQNKKNKLGKNLVGFETKLTNLLQKCINNSDDQQVLDFQFASMRDYLLTLMPSHIDFELARLSTFVGAPIEMKTFFLKFLEFWLNTNNQVDFCCAVTFRFVELYHDVIIKECPEILDDIAVCIKEKTTQMRHSHDLVNCLSSFIRSSSL